MLKYVYYLYFKTIKDATPLVFCILGLPAACLERELEVVASELKAQTLRQRRARPAPSPSPLVSYQEYRTLCLTS